MTCVIWFLQRSISYSWRCIAYVCYMYNFYWLHTWFCCFTHLCVVIYFFHASMGLGNIHFGTSWPPKLVSPRVSQNWLKKREISSQNNITFTNLVRLTPKYTYDSCTFETSKWLAWIWITIIAMLCTTQYHHYNYQMKWGVWYLKWLLEMLDVRHQEWLNQNLSSIMSKLNVQEKRNSYIDSVRDMSSFPFSISA